MTILVVDASIAASWLFEGEDEPLAKKAFGPDDKPDLDAALVISERRNLSFYDALYLELAQRRTAVLATLDRALCHAAVAEGVAVLD